MFVQRQNGNRTLACKVANGMTRELALETRVGISAHDDQINVLLSHKLEQRFNRWTRQELRTNADTIQTISRDDMSQGGSGLSLLALSLFDLCDENRGVEQISGFGQRRKKRRFSQEQYLDL